MPRGDLRKVKFQITDASGEVYTSATEIYFSVKQSTKSKQLLFQKKLSDGSIAIGQDNYYHFIIEPEDTNGFQYNEYAFDIEVVGPELKQTTVGQLVITDEVTFSTDEDTDDEEQEEEQE